jgi:predicted RNA binding protein YcfA (HicA-like mRNA interferase family)
MENGTANSMLHLVLRRIGQLLIYIRSSKQSLTVPVEFIALGAYPNSTFFYTLQLINQMIKYNDFVRQLLARGCSAHRKSGKHLIYRHPELNRNLVIPKAKTISLGIYRECDKLLTTIGA